MGAERAGWLQPQNIVSILFHAVIEIDYIAVFQTLATYILLL